MSHHTEDLSRLMALAAIDAEDECTMGELARPIDLPSPLATRVADELVAGRRAERAGDAADRRRVMIHLTGKGQAAREAVHREAEELVSGVLLA